MGNRQSRQSRFLADGQHRAVKALEPEIRKAVETEYQETLSNASFWQRFLIRRRIERQVQKRLAEKAPDDGLY